MLGITTFNRTQHLAQAFDCSPIIIGSRGTLGQSADDRIFVDDRLVQNDHCELRWRRVEGKLHVFLKVNGQSVALDSGPRIHPGVVVELKLPETFWIGDTLIQLDDLKLPCEYDKHLIVKPASDRKSLTIPNLDRAPSPATLTSWFEALGQIQRTSANTPQYFADTARACFSPGGLDGAMVIENTQSEWKILGSHIRNPELGIGFRHDLVKQAIEQNAVLYHNSQNNDAISNEKKQSVIVCPIAEPGQPCKTVLYGFRSLHGRNDHIGIKPLEAYFIELIAQNISIALKRIESDAEAAQNRVLLEQAFSPQVAQTLQQDPTILAGQNREITAMFCELRNLSAISEKVDPKITYEMLTEVMDYFCEIVSKHDGVIIDLYGDGLSAFWNAPLDTPNHAEVACQCAMEIKAIITVLEHRWATKLGNELRVGIGVHSGIAQVGNSGSKIRLKYRPLGNTVNLTASLESATKHIGTTILVSEATGKRLPEAYCLRRVCNAQLSGMKQTIEIHELLGPKITSAQRTLIGRYEQALNQFEAGNLDLAFQELSALTIDYDNDRVTEFLLTHCSKLVSGELDSINRSSTEAAIYPLVSGLTLASPSPTELSPYSPAPKALKNEKG